MSAGSRGKAKGSSFERLVCVRLSKWISGGKREDCLWRSAMSGGRATVGRKKGQDLRYQAGDITATHPLGHALTDHWYIECKFYKDLHIASFIFGLGGHLVEFWNTAVVEAQNHGREPMLIAKQNQKPIFVIVPIYEMEKHAWIAQCRHTVSYLNMAVLLDFDEMCKSKFANRVRITK